MDTLGQLGPDLQPRVIVNSAPEPVRGSWNRRRLEQVLVNRLDHALRDSPNGEPVTVTVDAGADNVTGSFLDRGVGVAPAELPRLFERFYRVEDAALSIVVGSGLDLYICAQIITAHGGRVWAESAGLSTRAAVRGPLLLRPAAATAARHAKGPIG